MRREIIEITCDKCGALIGKEPIKKEVTIGEDICDSCLGRKVYTTFTTGGVSRLGQVLGYKE